MMKMVYNKQQSLIKRFLCFGFVLVSTFGFAQNKWTLQQCISHAQENNISVKQGENLLLSNAEDVKAAKGSFLPSVSASALHSLTLGNTEVFAGQFVDRTSNRSSIGVGFSETIYNGLLVKNQYKQAKLVLEINDINLKQTKDDIALNVAVAYLNVLLFKERLDIANVQYQFSQKQLDQVKELVAAGVQPQVNVLDAEATLGTDAQNVTEAENTYNLGLLNLSQLLQIPFNGFEVEILDLDTPSLALMYNQVDDILSYALQNRGEIVVAQKQIENSELSTKIAKAALYPRITGSYNFGSNAFYTNLSDTENTFFNQLNDQKSHDIGLRVDIPIFSGFQNKTAVAKSKIAEENAKLSLQQAKLDLETTIQRAFTDAKAALKSYEAALKSNTSQKIAFNNAQERYDIGAMNAFDLEQVRVRYINAQSSLVNAKYDFVFKTKVLDFYIGKQITL
ncbi:MAG: TolC family protein [Flavobacteriaceae bacterium]|nr:TolC family protein [Flavobacteriaceae bacterium]